MNVRVFVFVRSLAKVVPQQSRQTWLTRATHHLRPGAQVYTYREVEKPMYAAAAADQPSRHLGGARAWFGPPDRSMYRRSVDGQTMSRSLVDTSALGRRVQLLAT